MDFNRGFLTINKQVQRERKLGGIQRLVETKNSRVRVIKAAPTVLSILRAEREKQAAMQHDSGSGWHNPHKLVFTTELGAIISEKSLYKRFKTIVADMGYPDVRFHDLRHSYAVAAIECGDDIKTIQENLGHATASFTLDVYGHVSQTMRDKSAARMEEFIHSISRL